ncbi:MAG: tetratricopeptide repeat protein [Ginsengibacter sp.]
MDRISKIKENLKESGDDSFLQHALALEYIKIGNDAEAKKLFEELLKREPNYLGSYYQLGKLLERTGEGKKAIEVYKKGMEVSKSANELRTYNELRSAFEEAADE